MSVRKLCILLIIFGFLLPVLGGCYPYSYYPEPPSDYYYNRDYDFQKYYYEPYPYYSYPYRFYFYYDYSFPYQHHYYPYRPY